jgi:GNAT superfamily N-acetyltransferase
MSHRVCASIRPYAPSDRAAVLELAPRLLVGIAPWRSPTAFLTAAQQWIAGSVDGIGPDAAVFVAEDTDGALIGFVSVSRQEHFTGEAQAYIGELAITASAEGAGVGRALVASVEHWAATRGLRMITLDTGAANTRARGFYAHLGYAEESVKLAKVLPGLLPGAAD